MTVNKRKKSLRFRGAKTTHGYGSKKKHRGSGNKGGRGMAGSGKRADQKKTKILVEYGTSYFGRRGFKRPRKIFKKFLNVGDISSYLNHEQVKKEGDFFAVDLKKLGFKKLLGKGKVVNKIKLLAPSVSKTAKRKIEEAGGEVVGSSDNK